MERQACYSNILDFIEQVKIKLLQEKKFGKTRQKCMKMKEATLYLF